MLKREIQSFSLKLSEIKEYELVRQERLVARQLKEGNNENVQNEGALQVPIIKVGPKSKQEIRDRIGL